MTSLCSLWALPLTPSLSWALLMNTFKAAAAVPPWRPSSTGSWSWRGRGVRDRHSRNHSGLLMSGCLIMAGRWLREEDGSPSRSGVVSLLSEERQMLSQMLLLPPFPSPVSCGRILCLSFGSELKTSPYSWSFDELCSQWVLTEKSMQRGWVMDCHPDPILPGVSWTI